MSRVSRYAASVFGVLATMMFRGASATAFGADESASTLSPRQLYYKPPVKNQRRVTKPASSTPDLGTNTTANPAGNSSSTLTPEPPNLGLRYSLLDADGQEIDAGKVFHSGDRIRLKVQTNSDAYVYVINQGPGGDLSALFPSAEIEHNNNWVESDRAVEVPAGQNFYFRKDETGIEKMIVVVSREREPDMERLMGSLKGARSKGASAKQLEAMNRPPAGEIDRLRSKLASRSIGVEPVHKDAKGTGEEAVYVAVSDPSNSRIITEIALKHE